MKYARNVFIKYDDFMSLKGKFSSGIEFKIIFKPLGSCMIFKIEYDFVI